MYRIWEALAYIQTCVLWLAFKGKEFNSVENLECFMNNSCVKPNVFYAIQHIIYDNLCSKRQTHSKDVSISSRVKFREEENYSLNCVC